MALTVELLSGTRDEVEMLWNMLEPLRPILEDDFPKSAFELTYLVAAPDAKCFIVLNDGRPIGMFLINHVIPGHQAYGHVFMWDRNNLPYRELIAKARLVAKSMMDFYNLRRLNGLTPCRAVPARVFLEHVGFKVEGTAREAVVIGGMPEDAWFSGLLKRDLDALVGANAPADHGTIEGSTKE